LIAIGEAGWGLEGFRESHAQALAAHRVATRLPHPMIRYRDVSLEATLMTDPDAARRFIKHELGPLAEENERSEKLRQTLEAYIRTGMNASAAAAALHVSDRTIAYRIRRLEEMLGVTVTGRGAELAAALRMKRLYN
jgi:DNA-binding PucR family transcriptional regulator